MGEGARQGIAVDLKGKIMQRNSKSKARGKRLRKTVTSFFRAGSHFIPSKSKAMIQTLSIIYLTF